jgi:hypothetical protein
MRAYVKQGVYALDRKGEGKGGRHAFFFLFTRENRDQNVDEPRSSPLRALRGWWTGNR